MTLNISFDKADYYTISKVSNKLEFTPQGFLLCRDVCLGRLGDMKYLPQEVTKINTVGTDGFITLTRTENELFSEKTIGSAIGMDVVNNHPTDQTQQRPIDVHVGNWKNFTVGTVLYPRRGEGNLSKFLIGDLLIKDENTIKDVLRGKREVSCGYQYDLIENDGREGHGWQTNIRFNHVALVDRGRCGSECRIMDKEMSILEKIKAAITSGDDSKLDEILAEGNHTYDKPPQFIIHNHMAAIDKKESDDCNCHGEKEENEKYEKDDSKKKDVVSDSAVLLEALAKLQQTIEILTEKVASFDVKPPIQETPNEKPIVSFAADIYREVVSRAEVISPGIQIPAFDTTLSAEQQEIVISDFRKSTLQKALDSETKILVDGLLAGTALIELTPIELKTVFNAVYTLKTKDNAKQFDVAIKQGVAKTKSPIKSMADLNTYYAKHWNQQ